MTNANEIKDDAQGDAQIQESGDQPAVVISVQDETRDPPTIWTSSVGTRKIEKNTN